MHFRQLDLLDQKILVKKLCQDFLGELAPKLGHKVASRKHLGLIQLGRDLTNCGDTEYIVVHNADLLI